MTLASSGTALAAVSIEITEPSAPTVFGTFDVHATVSADAQLNLVRAVLTARLRRRR